MSEDLQAAMALKIAQLKQAHEHLEKLQQQAQTINLHIQRLEGAVTMLRELGVALPDGVVVNGQDPAQEQEHAAVEGN